MLDYAVSSPASLPSPVSITSTSPSSSPSVSSSVLCQQEWFDPIPTWLSGLFNVPSPSVSAPMITSSISPSLSSPSRDYPHPVCRPSPFQSSSAPTSNTHTSKPAPLPPWLVVVPSPSPLTS
ncbi:hypothetical protein K435DRAFT_864216 [Dendrothele bispora CBS 962.96]|uniref:Uncharacterized protein n=1 Tax=Dendrothele bispora (strain CBS 962.96) TaxID=1314807 RepID=A0A4S8LMR6_DENBC|nr:hypothetical protein K435DRAFT_864216 [Dendrothele bispora CBS 962.96]